jgi:pimeloyl-ACP methyl ester carboxylesterase
VAPRLDSTITLADGRRLAYAEWGDPNGKPLFFFHGSPHSRLFCPDERATVAAGVRVISVDRPGIGRSDVLEARRLGDWPADVIALADSLGLDRFAVVGWSAGGPYAAACAALISPRLTGAAVVSTRHLSQYNFVERPESYEELDSDDRATYDLAQKDPTAAAELAAQQNAELVAMLKENPESFTGPAEQPEGDRWFFADQTIARPFYAAMSESVRQGADGFRWEMIDGWLPWGFRLDSIPMRVHLWHGEQDPRVPRRHADFTASRIPDCVLTVWPDVGHFGIAKYWGQVLDALTTGRGTTP